MLRIACILALLLVLWTATAAAEPAFPTYDDDGEALTIAQFVERYIPEDMPEGLGRTEVQAALEDAGTNWVELARATGSLQRNIQHSSSMSGEPFATTADLHNIIWLIVNAPHLDRLELDSTTLGMSVAEAGRHAKGRGFDPSSELFRRYVLNYRFDDEPVTPWRIWVWKAITHEILPRERVPLDSITMEMIVKEATRDFQIVERGYFGNIGDPMGLLHSRSGSERELALVVACALRSHGYPSRFVRENRSGESWVEVYTGDPREYAGDAWMPVYPTAPERSGDVGYATELCGGRITVVTAGDAFGREQVTGRYMPQGYVKPVFTRTAPSGAVEHADFEGWAITAWNAKTGGYAPLDDLDYPSADKDYPLSAYGHTPEEGVYALGPGEYRLECGVRYPGGITHVQTLPFSLSHAEQLALTLSLDPPTDLPMAAMVEREVAIEGMRASVPAEARPETAALPSSGRYVFLVRDDSEPSVRAAELLTPLARRSSVWFRELRTDTADAAEQTLIRDVLRVEPADSLPVVIVVVDAETRLYLRGYNLNIAAWVDRALEAE